MDIKVADMSCGHCTSSIEKAIKAADASATVTCDLETKIVHVETAQSADQIVALITNIGFVPEVIVA